MPGKIEKMQVKRERILDCSMQLFLEKGYINTSVRDIIESSGYGASTFYRYFQSREEILKTLLADFLDTIVRLVNDFYGTQENLALRFIESKRVVLEVFIENRPMAEIYSRSAGISAEIDSFLHCFDQRYIEYSSDNIRYGIEKGIFKDQPVLPIAHAILGTIKYAVYRWIVLNEIDTEEMIELVLSFHESLAAGMLR